MFACLRSPVPDAAASLAVDFSPRLQRYGRGCVVIDVSGLGRLLGAPAAIAEALVSASRAAAGAGAMRIAVAPTQVGARLLSHAGGAAMVVVDDLERALADLPLSALQSVIGEGAGVAAPPSLTPAVAGEHASAPPARAGRRLAAPARAARRFAGWPTLDACAEALDVCCRWGVHTLGALSALPGGELSARLGQNGVALQQLARGVDVAPLVPDPDVPRYLERIELEWPIDALEPLSFVLARLLDPLSARLARADRAAAVIRLDLRLVDRTTHARMLQLPAAMRDPRVLRTLLLLDLESHPPAAAIDIVTVEVDPAPARIVQFSLLDRARPSEETLATLLARLGALVGDTRRGAPVLRDSHKPDAFVLREYTTRPGREDAFVLREDTTRPGKEDAFVLREYTTRPGREDAFVLREDTTRPGKEDAFVLREDTTRPPVVHPTCLRRFRPPVAIRVRVERARPQHVAIDRRGMPGGGRGMPGGDVAQTAGPWRSSGGWWDAPASWNRDEWDVAFGDGARCRIFCDRVTGHWFMDGLLD